MTAAPRTRAILAASIAALLVLPALAGCAPSEPSPEEQETPGVTEPAAPDADGAGEIPAADTERALVESRCSQCHNLDRVWAAQMDAERWESTVRRMEANGLQLTDDERQRIVEYLAAQ